MNREEIFKLTGRSESWLRSHVCALCDRTLYHTLRHGCASMYERCDPTKKDFTKNGNISNLSSGERA